MKYIDIVFDDQNKGVHGSLPMPPKLEFVEVENAQGASVGVGRWIEREDGYTVLRLFEDATKSMTEPGELHEIQTNEANQTAESDD